MDSLPKNAEEYRQWWTETYPEIPYGRCLCGCQQKTNIVKQRNYAKKLRFTGEPHRFITSHSFRRPRPPSRYLEQDCGYETPCWVWQGKPSTWGYGYIGISRKKQRAHRVFYERKYGPIPHGLHLHHKCAPFGGPRLCVNPDHLEPMSKLQNSRLAKNLKLNMQMAEEIRRVHKEEGLSFAAIARRYGTSDTLVRDVIKNRIWS